MTMRLNFEKEGDLWVAKQQVNDDYNVKVECEMASIIIVSHNTSGTKFAVVHAYRNVDVVDDDFDGCVWPKTIRITSTEQPTYGEITEAN
ncbi:MAG: hypothetical protein MJZ30_06105 [Paludibacteraceae bacterium]|nr:hypothetical protein [Paludibacteraceae bacterium]